jgi:hypothetical protein
MRPGEHRKRDSVRSAALVVVAFEVLGPLPFIVGIPYICRQNWFHTTGRRDANCAERRRAGAHVLRDVEAVDDYLRARSHGLRQGDAGKALGRGHDECARDAGRMGRAHRAAAARLDRVAVFRAGDGAFARTRRERERRRALNAYTSTSSACAIWISKMWLHCSDARSC